MPRNDRQRPIGAVDIYRAGGADPVSRSPALQVQAPLIDVAPQSVGQQLAVALGVVGPTAAKVMQRKQDREDIAAGTADGAVNKVDAERAEKSRMYRVAATTTAAEASYVRFNDELKQEYEAEFVAGRDELPEPAEVEAWLNKRFEENYKGLDDPAIAERLIPLMQKTRGTLLGKHIEDFRAEQHTKHVANTAEIFEHNYRETMEAALKNAPPGTQRWDVPGQLDMHDMHDRLYSTLGGRASNEAMFQIVAKLAIENGHPELLDQIPDNWNDKQKTFKHVPEFAARILNAKLQAANMRSSFENAQAKAEEAALKQQKQDTLAEVFRNAIRNNGAVPPSVYENPMFDASDLENIHGFAHTVKGRDEEPADWGEIHKMTYDVFMGRAGYKDIYEFAAAGKLGSGKTASGLLNQLMDDAQRAERQTEAANKNRHLRSALDDINVRYKIRMDPITKAIYGEDHLQVMTQLDARQFASDYAEANPEATRQQIIDATIQAVKPYDTNLYETEVVKKGDPATTADDVSYFRAASYSPEAATEYSRSLVRDLGTPRGNLRINEQVKKLGFTSFADQATYLHEKGYLSDSELTLLADYLETTKTSVYFGD